MKTLKALFAAAALFSSLSANAASGTDVFVSYDGDLLSMTDIIADGDDIQSNYHFQDYQYCYEGSADAAAALLQRWNREGNFYSGGGGGFELKKTEILRGFVTYDVKLTFEDEVVPGEYQNKLIKPCSSLPKN